MRAGTLWVVALLSAALGVACTPHAIAVQNAIAKGDRQYLLNEVTHSTDEWIVEDAARGLGQLKAAEAVGPLTAVLTDPNAGPYRRGSAGLALGRIHDTASIKPLISALDRATDAEERYWLVVGLYQFCGTPGSAIEVQSALEKASSDTDVIIRYGAKKGLYECGQKAAPNNPPATTSNPAPRDPMSAHSHPVHVGRAS